MSYVVLESHINKLLISTNYIRIFEGIFWKKANHFVCVYWMQMELVVYNMLHEDTSNLSYSTVGGLKDQIRELRESIELPLMNPELFLRVGIKPPKVKFV